MVNKQILLLAAVVPAVLAVSLYVWPLSWSSQPYGMMLPQQMPFNYGYLNMMGQCPHFGWYWGQTTPTGQRLSIQQAVDILQRYVADLGGNYRLYEVMEFQYNFYAIVVESDTGIGAFELLVNPYTGYIYPEPGPNMMWNTKYGMHYRMMGWYNTPTADMPINPEQAEEIALNYLTNLFQGRNVEIMHPTRFYGYYTMDYKLDGRIHGMLSVNGFTGQVWYHSWHGQFIQEIELEGIS